MIALLPLSLLPCHARSWALPGSPNAPPGLQREFGDMSYQLCEPSPSVGWINVGIICVAAFNVAASCDVSCNGSSIGACRRSHQLSQLGPSVTLGKLDTVSRKGSNFGLELSY